ncbi:MAG: hypothetical protein F4Z31_04970 [Gemmatimonadetes bacterium]|nr:hypothetical protein [Gemmatimonadota bacterium]MYE95684.1 hypothetical protein [Gemmatimonadota bacterium]MYJ12213.1 hypothetical protein [Gemmatimonadota bacterium]
MRYKLDLAAEMRHAFVADSKPKQWEKKASLADPVAVAIAGHLRLESLRRDAVAMNAAFAEGRRRAEKALAGWQRMAAANRQRLEEAQVSWKNLVADTERQRRVAARLTVINHPPFSS